MKKKKYPELPERSHPDYNRLYRQLNREKLSIKNKLKYQENREEILLVVGGKASMFYEVYYLVPLGLCLLVAFLGQ